jgi:hypothetical protein
MCLLVYLQAHWTLPWRDAVELATAAALAAVLSDAQLFGDATASISSSSSSSSDDVMTAVSTGAVRVLQALNRVRYNSFAVTAVVAASHSATVGTAVDTQVSLEVCAIASEDRHNDLSATGWLIPVFLVTSASIDISAEVGFS